MFHGENHWLIAMALFWKRPESGRKEKPEIVEDPWKIGPPRTPEAGHACPHCGQKIQVSLIAI